jgi:4-nitrophenyl phosphatase
MIETTNIRGLILDMDGVLWRDQAPIGNLPQQFELIRQMGLGVVLATNNAARNPAQYAAKLKGFGVDLDPGQIVNSAMATAHYLHNHFPQGGDIFVVGEQSLANTIEAAGFTTTGEGSLAVVAALYRGINYEILTKATLLIRGGALFIGTNPDKTFPIPDGQAPGAGAILAALEAATGMAPLIMGKPQPEMYYLALERLELLPEETLVVGDRLETDIVGAQEAGCPAALVLSGVTSFEAAQKWTPPPDIISADLSSVLEILRSS